MKLIGHHYTKKNTNTQDVNVQLFILTRLMRAQHPPRSVLARCFRTYLKYTCSRAKRTAANSMPDISSRKADKNCSRARGSLDLCSCFPGLHVPVIQYRRSLSRSPAKSTPSLSFLNCYVKLFFLTLSIISIIKL